MDSASRWLRGVLRVHDRHSNYGSVISAVPPILAGLAQSPSKALLVVIVYLIVNQIEGNLILPLIMARTMDMHPAVVTIGLLVMGALFWLIGVLIAIPLLSLAIILVQALWIEPQEAPTALTDPDELRAPPPLSPFTTCLRPGRILRTLRRAKRDRSCTGPRCLGGQVPLAAMICW